MDDGAPAAQPSKRMRSEDSAGAAAAVVVDPPEKSPNDKLAYRLLVFENGFEAMLVSTDDAKKSKAAASVAVAAGSFSDPQGRCEGLAHYLEHMLFMGSEKYPGEDEMEQFLSKNGGHSNAFTEAAYTCYYLEVNKAHLHKALDILAQLFVAPLLKTDAAEREINAIDSEFRLTQNSDSSRVEQLFASYARLGHPFRIFGWGNLASLAEATKKAGVDINEELRAFYSLHYRAPRLRLCVYGVEPLDSLEAAVRASFSGLPAAAPGEPPGGPQEALLSAAGRPFQDEVLPKLLRVRPVKDTHKLSMSWQMPPTLHLYKTRPAQYISHLVGHEGAGSLLSWLKQRGLATQLTAGVGGDSFSDNTMCCIFQVSVTLTVAGLEAWPDVAHATLLYLDMLRREGPQEWVHQEIVLTQEMGWRFLEESNPTDQVQSIASQMLPFYQVERRHILRAQWMPPEWDPEAVAALLAEMRPERLMLDVLSSAYGRAKGTGGEEDEGEGQGKEAEKDDAEEGKGEGEGESESGEEGEEGEAEEGADGEDAAARPDAGAPAAGPPARDPAFDPEADGAPPPQVEPLFGTEYWEAPPDEVQRLLARWRSEPAAGSPLAEAKAELRLPDRNRFLATDFELRPEPLEVLRAAPPVPAEGLRGLYASFPPLPEPLPPQPRPLPGAAALGLRAWHLQDTVFKTPRSCLWLKLSTDEAPLDPTSASQQVLLSLMVQVLWDLLNETAYMAEQACLHIRVAGQSYGLDLQVGGFDHKLPLLLEAGLQECLSFGDPAVWQRRSTDKGFMARLEAQREQLLRGYRNAYLRPGDHAADLRRVLLMPHRQGAPEKAKALEAVDFAALASFSQALLPQLRAEVLYSGNATDADAEELVKGLPASLRERSDGAALEALPRHPALRVAAVPLGAPTACVEDSPDTGNRNVAVELYWQIEASREPRKKVVLDVLEDVMSEPLFDTLRTKQQLGYVASCGMRQTQGVLGFSIWLLSSKVGPAEICRRVEAFLPEFRERLVGLPAEDVERHVVALAAHKLEPDRTLTSVQSGIWEELQERRRVFDKYLREAIALAGVGRQDLIDVLDRCIVPGAPDRRLLITAAVGGKAKTTRAAEVEALKELYPGVRVVSSQADFLASTTLIESPA